MGLDARVKTTESKVMPSLREQDHTFDLDQYVLRLGLVPDEVRGLARDKGYSLVEAMCELVGIEAREFKWGLQ